LTTKFLSEPQAAAFLAELGLTVAPKTLRKLRCVGGGPSFVKFGRAPLYQPEALDRWVEEKLTPPKRSTSDNGKPA
jgi:hypothetical protein